MAWTRETSTEKRGRKLYVHGHGKGRAAAGDVLGVGPDASLIGLCWRCRLRVGKGRAQARGPGLAVGPWVGSNWELA